MHPAKENSPNMKYGKKGWFFVKGIEIKGSMIPANLEIALQTPKPVTLILVPYNSEV